MMLDNTITSKNILPSTAWCVTVKENMFFFMTEPSMPIALKDSFRYS